MMMISKHRLRKIEIQMKVVEPKLDTGPQIINQEYCLYAFSKTKFSVKWYRN